MSDQGAPGGVIVGTGASAGGIDVFQTVFENMPADPGMSLGVILHLPPDRKSLMREILMGRTKIPVIETDEACAIAPNAIYAPPPGGVATIENGQSQPHPVAVDEPREPTPIDAFETAPQGGDEAAATEAPVVIDADLESQLEAELRDVREQLRSLTEDHGAALEDLRRSNEALETSKEEIQSIYDELHAVNAQLSAKLEELDLKNNDLRNLFESAQVATVFLDGHCVIRSFTPAMASIYDLIPTDVGRALTDIVSRLAYNELRSDVGRVLADLAPLERRVARDDGSANYLIRIQPYRTHDSTVTGVVITFVDVSSLVQAEQQQRLLVDELNHRVKNMLTVVISLAVQTIRRSASMEEFSRTYIGRVHALSTAYAILSNRNWQKISLQTLIREELDAFAAGGPARVRLGGPPVLLEPRAALALGLAIHELATNAVKFGALSTPEGKVDLTWRVASDASGAWMYMDWTEIDGPPVAGPIRRGVGMTLIERGLKQDMDAEINVDFAPAGVRASLKAPLGETSPFGGDPAGSD